MSLTKLYSWYIILSMIIKIGNICVVLFILLISLPTGVFSKNTDIAFANDRINICADNTALSSIIEELSKQMGIKVYLDKSQAGNNVTVDIRNVSFEKGLKMLTYPLNYVIMRGSQGEIRELRIFKNPGLADNNYKVFGSYKQAASTQGSGGSSQDSGDRVQSSEDRRQKTEDRIQGAVTSSASLPEIKSAIRNPQSEIGSSEPVTGDRAFNYGIWATQRMLAYEAMREQTQVKAEQANTQQKELAPIQNTVSISNITQQAMSQNLQQTSSPVQLSPSSQNYPSYQMNSNNSYNNSMNMWMMSYMQQMSQQRSFNEFIYYQQKSYNNYNSVLNSRGPAAR